MMENKKGELQTGRLFLFLIIGFTLIIIIGTFLYSFNTITTNLLSVQTSGQVDFSNATANTMGKLNSGLLSHGGLIALFLLFGQMIGMLFTAFLTRESNPSVFFVFEIFILIFVYVLATYISNAYETVITNVPFTDTFTSNLNGATTLLLKLPLIVTIIGVLMMIVGYAGIVKTKEEEVAGF